MATMYYAKPSFCFFCTTTRPYTPTHLATGQGVYTRDRSIHIGRGSVIKKYLDILNAFG